HRWYRISYNIINIYDYDDDEGTRDYVKTTATVIVDGYTYNIDYIYNDPRISEFFWLHMYLLSEFGSAQLPTPDGVYITDIGTGGHIDSIYCGHPLNSSHGSPPDYHRINNLFDPFFVHDVEYTEELGITEIITEENKKNNTKIQTEYNPGHT